MRPRDTVPRQILRKVRDGFKGEEPGYASLSLAGHAAVLLSDSYLPADQELVQSNWEKNPDEFGYLVALISLGVRQGTGFELVQRLFSDPGRPLWVRVLAAALLSTQNRSAASFFYSEMDQMLTEVGSVDGITLIQSRMAGKDVKISIRFPFSLVSVLQQLRTPAAEALTFKHLDSRNVFQNRALGMLAAQRWPERLVRITTAPDADRKKLLAVVAVTHPELSGQISGLVPAAELQLFVADVMRLDLDHGKRSHGLSVHLLYSFEKSRDDEAMRSPEQEPMSSCILKMSEGDQVAWINGSLHGQAIRGKFTPELENWFATRQFSMEQDARRQLYEFPTLTLRVSDLWDSRAVLLLGWCFQVPVTEHRYGSRRI